MVLKTTIYQVTLDGHPLNLGDEPRMNVRGMGCQGEKDSEANILALSWGRGGN